jgi:hypothetical protein
MQRVVLRELRVRAILALVVAAMASVLLIPALGGSAQSASNAPAHLCPPAC